MKNSFKRVLAVALSAAMVLTAAPLASINANAATKVKLSATKGTIKVGKTKKVTIKGLKKSNIKSVKFTYSNTKKRVTVKRSGLTIKITGKKKGTVTVTATIKLKKAVNKKKTYKLKYKATVKKAAATKVATTAISLPAEITVAAGSTTTVTATRTPSNANDDITWTSKDETIATVANGVVTGVKEGETEISAVAGTATAAVAKVKVTAPVVADKAEIESAVVTAADKIEVTFKATVDPKKVTMGLKKNDAAQSLADPVWGELNKTVTVVTKAPMTAGKYVVTATTEGVEEVSTFEVEVKDREVKEIKITNKDNIAYTGKKGATANAEAYAYYDIVDQYGDSMADSVSIQWSASCKLTEKKANRQITLEKSDGTAWVYGNQIYLTGVYTKTGQVCQATLTVGQEQAPSSVEMKGFINKADSNKILDTLPAGFKEGEYFLIFKVKDQGGNSMDVANVDKMDECVSFIITDGILVIAEVKTTTTTKVVNGEEYATASIKPGIDVSKGGNVVVEALANKTGEKTALNFMVGTETVLSSFEISGPKTDLYDGEDGELEFTALDAEGNKITNFDYLAKQKTFNTLSFTTSVGTIALEEQNDGSAKLFFFDDVKFKTGSANDGWTNSETTDGNDRPINVTSVVVGGNSSNTMFYVGDKARPAAIGDVNLADAYLEGATVGLNMGSFHFIDQYGREMGGSDKTVGTYWGTDNGFFTQAEALNRLNGADFNGYAFGVMADYYGEGALGTTNAALTDGLVTPTVNGQDAYTNGTFAGFVASTNNGGDVVITPNGTAVAVAAGSTFVRDRNVATNRNFVTCTNVSSSKTTDGFKFSIVKTKAGEDKNWEMVGKVYNKEIAVIDVTQVGAFKVSTPADRFYIGAINTYSGGQAVNAATGTGDGILKQAAAELASNLDASALATTTGFGSGANTTVSVTGTWQGKTVPIPSGYFKVTGQKVTTTGGGAAFGNAVVNAIVPNKILLSDLYNKSAANYPAIDGKDTLKATIYERYTGSSAAAGYKYVLIGAGTEPVKDTASKNILFSDQARKATSFTGIADEVTATAEGTRLNAAATVGGVAIVGSVGPANPDYYKILGARGVAWNVLDQYGDVFAGGTVTFKATNIVENEKGYAKNNFKVTDNDSATMKIDGAERGDTFDLVVTIDGLSKTVKVTVGSDRYALITSAGAGNVYRDLLTAGTNANGILELQRLESLK